MRTVGGHVPVDLVKIIMNTGGDDIDDNGGRSVCVDVTVDLKRFQRKKMTVKTVRIKIYHIINLFWIFKRTIHTDMEAPFEKMLQL